MQKADVHQNTETRSILGSMSSRGSLRAMANDSSTLGKPTKDRKIDDYYLVNQNISFVPT